MSAWIVDNDSINKIVNSFYWLKDNTYLRDELKRKFGLSFEGFHKDLNEELRKFGQMLVDLNRSSVNQRYNEEEKPFEFVFSDVKPLSIFQFLKSIECLSYQSCEGNCDKTELYKFLQELEEHLRYLVIQDIPEYKKAKWE